MSDFHGEEILAGLMPRIYSVFPYLMGYRESGSTTISLKGFPGEWELTLFDLDDWDIMTTLDS